MVLAGRFFAYVSIAELGVHTVQLSAIRLDVGIDEEIERLPLLARRENDVATLREFHPGGGPDRPFLPAIRTSTITPLGRTRPEETKTKSALLQGGL